MADKPEITVDLRENNLRLIFNEVEGLGEEVFLIKLTDKGEVEIWNGGFGKTNISIENRDTFCLSSKED